MTHHEPASPLTTAFTHRCPACQEASLYKGVLGLKETCDSCGLDYTEHDIGDGPAFFTITLLGFVVVGLSFALEIYVRPSYAVHAAVVLGAMAILTPACLRFFKSYLIALKYKVHWSEGMK